jgi:tRNA dimethylallyltransferase
MGPTAAGKTGLAVELVKQFPLEIISVDSALVYRGMDIGTAKPDAQTLAAAPHRLIDICDPTEAYSAARFSDDARQEIGEINRAGKYPLLVGGTMLYYRALLEGLSKLPQADPETRARIEARAAIEGWPALHEELSKLDPEAAGRINPNDPQRIQRSLEVIELTGQRMSELQAATAPTEEHYQPLKLVICPDERKVLHERIAGRFQMMLDEGFVDEVRVLRKIEGIHAALPSMRAVGYRQCWQWLEGTLKADEWQEKAIAATRQLAKRQLTWLRREKQALWYDLSKGGSSEQVFDAVREFLNRRN